MARIDLPTHPSPPPGTRSRDPVPGPGSPLPDRPDRVPGPVPEPLPRGPGIGPGTGPGTPPRPTRPDSPETRNWPIPPETANSGVFGRFRNGEFPAMGDCPWRAGTAYPGLSRTPPQAIPDPSPGHPGPGSYRPSWDRPGGHPQGPLGMSNRDRGSQGSHPGNPDPGPSVPPPGPIPDPVREGS